MTTPTQQIDLVAMRKLAMAATPGPWIGDRIDGTVKYDLIAAGGERVICGDNSNSDSGPYGIMNEEDERYLLAWHPAAALALLDRLESAERELMPDCADPQAQAVAPAEVEDLAALVRKLVHSLNIAKPGSDLAKRAVEYLRRKGLQGSPLREQAQAVAIPAGFVLVPVMATEAMHRAAIKTIIRSHGNDGLPRRRYADAVLALTKVFALASAGDEAREIREEVGFFQAIRAALVRSSAGVGVSQQERELAVQQIVSRAVVSTEIVDILAAAGIKSPDITIRFPVEYPCGL